MREAFPDGIMCVGVGALGAIALSRGIRSKIMTRLTSEYRAALWESVMSHIFISYVEEDGDLAGQIAEALEQEHYASWYYQRDSLPGTDYLELTGEAIEKCQAFVLLISPHTLAKANQVTKEVVRAHECGKKFIPILRGVTHLEFQNRQPGWRQAIGAATSIVIPLEGLTSIFPRLLTGLAFLDIRPGLRTPSSGDDSAGGVTASTLSVREPIASMPRQKSAPTTSKPVDALKIRGGCSLQGEVVVRGAKNTLPKNLIASLLTTQRCVLRNVAGIPDIDIALNMIRTLGGEVDWIGDSALEISTAKIDVKNLDSLRTYSKLSRIPVLFCGPLLHRFGSAMIIEPGGCRLGPRPIDFHFKALQGMGAIIEECSNGVFAKANKLIGAQIRLDYPSVGATEQVLLTAVRAQGVTELSNASIEPEVLDLVRLLNLMGGRITIGDNRVITIHGVEELRGFNYPAMTDRSEVASWACAAAATSGRVFVRNATEDGLTSFLEKFREMGGTYKVEKEGITFSRKNASLNSVFLETGCHPGFRTDWQPPFVIALTQADGKSEVHETVFEDRFRYIDNLRKRGADIKLFTDCPRTQCRFGSQKREHHAIIRGPISLGAEDVNITDLRGGFACVIAALLADGESTLRNCSWVAKGYERICEKLLGLGAEVEPV